MNFPDRTFAHSIIRSCARPNSFTESYLFINRILSLAEKKSALNTKIQPRPVDRAQKENSWGFFSRADFQHTHCRAESKNRPITGMKTGKILSESHNAALYTILLFLHVFFIVFCVKIFWKLLECLRFCSRRFICLRF